MAAGDAGQREGDAEGARHHRRAARSAEVKAKPTQATAHQEGEVSARALSVL